MFKRNASPDDIEAALQRAREQLAMEDEAAAYGDDFDDYLEVDAA